MERILVSGDQGLIGAALSRRLRESGREVVNYDIAGTVRRDILDSRCLDAAMENCTGIVHLAAVSRVIHGELDPPRCWLVNTQGTQNIIAAAARRPRKRMPWIIYGSSREVYGRPARLPVPESAPARPVNVYARSKASAENLVAAARDSAGLHAAVVRFSSVYGSAADHRDRVVPAFARAAAHGRTLRVEGSETLLDFTHVDDVAGAVATMTELMSAGERLPTVHLASGEGTTLMDLARMATEISGKGGIEVAAARPYDVSAFVGDPGLANRVLGWTPTVPLKQGVGLLIEEFQRQEPR
jgi:nucleoside-diphosphate-sugar epimerase